MKGIRGYISLDLFPWLFMAALAAIFGAFIGLAMLADRTACSSRAETMGLPHKWGPLLGCMVKVDDHYVPIDAIRYINGHVGVEPERTK